MIPTNRPDAKVRKITQNWLTGGIFPSINWASTKPSAHIALLSRPDKCRCCRKAFQSFVRSTTQISLTEISLRRVYFSPIHRNHRSFAFSMMRNVVCSIQNSEKGLRGDVSCSSAKQKETTEVSARGANEHNHRTAVAQNATPRSCSSPGNQNRRSGGEESVELESLGFARHRGVRIFCSLQIISYTTIY